MNQQILDNRYKLESEIGRGGMGVVYRAEDTQVKRTVAIKTLPAVMTHNQELMKRFNSEVQNASKLEHPNIARVFDVGEDAGTHYYVMQYIDGSDLRAELNKQGRYSVDETIRIISQIADALDYAHSQGIVHRDIKPENILLDKDGNAHVVDFGIAKATEGTRTTRGMLGTPEYMSPEQVKGKNVDGRSDQYSLATVAYEMLTGRTPFKTEGDDPWAQINMHLNTPVPSPKTTVPDLPIHVANSLLQALAKQPEQRFERCSEFVRALKGEIIARLPANMLKVSPKIQSVIVAIGILLVVLLAITIFCYTGGKSMKLGAVRQPFMDNKTLEIAFIDKSGQMPILCAMKPDGTDLHKITVLPKDCSTVVFADDYLNVAYIEGNNLVIYGLNNREYRRCKLLDAETYLKTLQPKFSTSSIKSVLSLISEQRLWDEKNHDSTSPFISVPDSIEPKCLLVSEDRRETLKFADNKLTVADRRGVVSYETVLPFGIVSAHFVPKSRAVVIIGGSHEKPLGIYLLKTVQSQPILLKKIDCEDTTYVDVYFTYDGNKMIYHKWSTLAGEDDYSEVGIIDLKTQYCILAIPFSDKIGHDALIDGNIIISPDDKYFLLAARKNTVDGRLIRVQVADGKRQEIVKSAMRLTQWIQTSPKTAVAKNGVSVSAGIPSSAVMNPGLTKGYKLGGNLNADFDGDGQIETAYWATRDESDKCVDMWLVKNSKVVWRFDNSDAGGMYPKMLTFANIDVTREGRSALLVNIGIDVNDSPPSFRTCVFRWNGGKFVNLLPSDLSTVKDFQSCLRYPYYDAQKDEVIILRDKTEQGGNPSEYDIRVEFFNWRNGNLTKSREVTAKGSLLQPKGLDLFGSGDRDYKSVLREVGVKVP